jgi:hypothetical protein
MSARAQTTALGHASAVACALHDKHKEFEMLMNDCLTDVRVIVISDDKFNGRVGTIARTEGKETVWVTLCEPFDDEPNTAAFAASELELSY